MDRSGPSPTLDKLKVWTWGTSKKWSCKGYFTLQKGILSELVL